MGQYYQAINLTNRLFVSPNGMKLMEHSWIGNSTMDNICRDIEKGNKSFKTRWIWCGDYADGEMEEPIYLTRKQLDIYENSSLYDPEYPEINPYDLCIDKYWETEVTTEMEVNFFSEVKTDPEYSFDYKGKYLINYDKEEYVSFDSLPEHKYNWDDDDRSWTVHPLSLLMCISNGRGGGDYHGEAGQDYIGTWANDTIGIDSEIPEYFFEINPNFQEQ